MATAILRILAAFDSFAVLISTLGRKSFDPQRGPIEVDDAVFAFREANVIAWGEEHFHMPNFLNITALSQTLTYYGALLFVATTRNGASCSNDCAFRVASIYSDLTRTHGMFGVAVTGERAHLRAKGINSNGRNYLLGTYSMRQ